MPGERLSDADQVRTAEVIAALCLATDLAMAFPLEHGLHSTLVAVRLAERPGADTDTAFDTYYGCLLFYAGCTTDAETSAQLFPEGALRDHFTPVMFGSSAQTLRGIVRALTDPEDPPLVRTARGVSRLPRGGARPCPPHHCHVRRTWPRSSGGAASTTHSPNR